MEKGRRGSGLFGLERCKLPLQGWRRWSRCLFGTLRSSETGFSLGQDQKDVGDYWVAKLTFSEAWGPPENI